LEKRLARMGIKSIPETTPRHKEEEDGQAEDP